MRWSEGREHAEGQLQAQGGLADQEGGEAGGRVEVEIGQHPQRFELLVIELLRLVDDQDGDTAAFGGFTGQDVVGLGGGWRRPGEAGAGVEAGGLAAGHGDLLVNAAGADPGVGDVDGPVAGGVEAGQGGANAHGLACADLAGQHGHRAGGDGPGGAGRRSRRDRGGGSAGRGPGPGRTAFFVNP